MIDFSKEHPEVVRLMADWMQSELIKTKKELANARAEVEARKQLDLIGVSDQLLIFRKLIFGRGSEKRTVDRERADEQISLYGQSLVPPLKEKHVQNLPEEVAVYDFSETELKAESEAYGLADPAAAQWELVPSFYDESSLITVREREYKIIKCRRQKWKLKSEFNKAQKEVIITAPGPAKLLPGCGYSIEFATSVVSDKYIHHMPLERQTRAMESLGLTSVHTKTLYNLCMAVGIHMEPIAEKIKEEILKSLLCVHCDETPWPIQIKNQDDGYMWVVSNQAGSFYRFEPTRSGKVIEDMLAGYEGPILTDGYTGYNRLGKMPNIQLANCWAHVRRKFTDIEENYPQETEEILGLIGKLFQVEHRAKSFEELTKLRLQESSKIIEEIKSWLLAPRESARRGSHLLKAIEYPLKYWNGLTLFLADTRVPLTNNEAERTIRHAVMGRKNFYGSRTHNGADTAATLYTIIESCKKVELDPRTYIEMAVTLSAQKKAAPTPLEYARLTRAN